MPLLSIVIWLPVVGALLLLLISNRDGSEGRAGPQRHARRVAGDVRWRRWRCGPASTCTGQAGEFQFVERLRWIPAFGIEYYLGIDGISLMLIVLTGFLTPIALLSGWESIHKKVKEFSIFMLLLEASMLGVFAALDVFLFYVFWDFVLIPMYFLIGVWGYDRRIYAAVKFILYTMAGSVLMLVAIIGLSWLHQTATGSLQLRPAQAVSAADSREHAVLVLPRLRAGVCDQGAALPVPHLAARRPRRGADARLGDPGRRDAEDGLLRARSLRLPALPGSGALLRADARDARR